MRFKYALVFVFIAGCAAPRSKPQNQAHLPPASDLSLKSSHGQHDADTRRANEDLALIFALMKKPYSGDWEEPSKVREKFNRILRERRASFDKELRLLRDQFNQKEGRERKDFLHRLNRERDAYRAGRRSRDKTRAFYTDQDVRRQDYFANEKDRRKDFESQITERRRNFEAFARERQQMFSQEHAAYTKMYNDARKASKGNAPLRSSTPDEFDLMPPPNVQLGVGGE